MAKKKQTNETQPACLTISKVNFESQLDNCIARVEEILRMNVSPINTNHFGFARYPQTPQYNDSELNAFRKAYLSWIDYVAELLTRSFDIPDNNYLRNFSSAGQRMFYTGNEDILKMFKDELIEKRDNIESLKNRLPLIPSKIQDDNKQSNQ